MTLQVCGADQWGNSLAGVEMIRKLEGKPAHVYSTPLIIDKTTGQKFGKSEAGTIWLDPNKTSVYQFYQFWLNVDDASAADYLKIYTLIDLGDYDSLMTEFQENPSERAAQKYLASEVTTIVHGEAAAKNVQKVTEVLFGDAQISALDEAQVDLLADEIPVVKTGVSLIDALVQTKAATSNGEARRLIESGGISINGQKVSADQQLSEKSLIKKGKNSFILVR